MQTIELGGRPFAATGYSSRGCTQRALIRREGGRRERGIIRCGGRCSGARRGVTADYVVARVVADNKDRGW